MGEDNELCTGLAARLHEFTKIRMPLHVPINLSWRVGRPAIAMENGYANLFKIVPASLSVRFPDPSPFASPYQIDPARQRNKGNIAVVRRMSIVVSVEDAA